MARFSWSDEIRWFDPLAKCRCGKDACGTLRGPRNDSYGTACRRCGESAVIAAKRERSALSRAVPNTSEGV